MKKLTALLFSVLLLMSFAACQKGETNGDSSKTSAANGSDVSSSAQQKTTVPEQRIDHIAQSIEQGQFEGFDRYTDGDKEKIKKAVEKDGYSLVYNDDGSGTLSNDEGSWFVGKGWVNNKFTDGLPKPEFGVITMSAQDKDDSGDFYIFLIRKASVKEVTDYVDKLETLGFKAQGEKVESIENGAVVFNAENEQGKKVEIAYSSNGFTYKIYVK